MTPKKTSTLLPVVGALACGGSQTAPWVQGTTQRPDGAPDAWLVYYDDGECVSGSCTWQKREILCGTGCSNGGRVFAGTVPPAMAPGL
ncbi:MAG: hypothetical protein ACLP1X_32675 [Polyangiaceae bacterium]